MIKYSLLFAFLWLNIAFYSSGQCQDEATHLEGEAKSELAIMVALPSDAAPPLVSDYSQKLVELIGNPSVQNDLELVNRRVLLMLGVGPFAYWGTEWLEGMYSVEGQTLPSAYYLRDDIQYFPKEPEFKLQTEAEALGSAQHPVTD